MKPITNPIKNKCFANKIGTVECNKCAVMADCRFKTLRNQGITINTNDKEATRRMQEVLNEMSIRDEGKPQESRLGIFACGVGEV